MSPWWSFDGIKSRLGRFQFLLLLIALFAITAYAGFRLGAEYVAWQAKELQSREGRLQSLYQEIDQKERQINYLTVELEVEQNASARVRDELLEVRQEALQLQKELSFYQKVLAPELVADGLAIEQFAIEKTNKAFTYTFRFAVVQTDTRKRNAKGYVRLNLIGSDEGQRQTLDLAKLANLNQQDLRFSFHYFQYFEGEFTLAEGFVPEDVEIKVVQPKTKWQPYNAFSEKIDWPNLDS